jgi:hypothetical protein
LVHLPPELLEQILSFFIDEVDTICLAISCKELWVRLHHHVRAAIMNEHAHWAGDRIFINGDYASSLPTALKNDEEACSMSLRAL